MTQSALAVQPGGDHYRKCAIQPIEFITTNGWGFIEGNILKYLTRFATKNGRQDLEKANHYVDLGDQLPRQKRILGEGFEPILIEDFIAANNITDPDQVFALQCLEQWVGWNADALSYINLKSAITKLIIMKYPVDN
jgi:hypothetical protein